MSKILTSCTRLVPLVFNAFLKRFCPVKLSRSQLQSARIQSFLEIFPSEFLKRLVRLPCENLLEDKMGKTAGGFYAVARGRNVGIFITWDECKAQVNGFPNARYKKFPLKQEAENFITENGGALSAVKTEGDSKNVFSTSQPKSSSAPIAVTGQFYPQMSSIILTKPLWESRTTGIDKPTASDGMASPAASARNFNTSAPLNKRSLKVTEERVTGRKRAKLDKESANAGVELSRYTIDEDGYVVVFTDGACRANGKRGARAGIGVWFGDDHSLNISERVKGRQTNNTAEIQAAERAIIQAKSNGINKLKLMTDSQFTINCVTKWLKNWKRNGWKLGNGSAVKNKEDLEKLENSMEGIEIKWSYVQGHAGHKGNEEADRLAVLGSQMN